MFVIVQDNGFVFIVELEIFFDGDYLIDRIFEVAERVWVEVFYYLVQNNVLFEGIFFKFSMVIFGVEYKEKVFLEIIVKNIF